MIHISSGMESAYLNEHKTEKKLYRKGEEVEIARGIFSILLFATSLENVLKEEIGFLRVVVTFFYPPVL